jgi:hypothetical protein
MNIAIFLDIEPCSPSVKRHYGRACNLHLQDLKSAEQEISVKMEVIRSSETSDHIPSTRRYIPEDCKIYTAFTSIFSIASGGRTSTTDRIKAKTQDTALLAESQ